MQVEICQECLNLCLQEADVKDRRSCIESLQDCSEICSTSACFMARGSINTKDICTLCASICKKCATECNMFKEQHCKTCADTCNQCATECEKMSKM